MTTDKEHERPAEYILPARRLSGTREEVLAQIDELIQGLVGLRQVVLLRGPLPAAAPSRRLRLVKKAMHAVFGL